MEYRRAAGGDRVSKKPAAAGLVPLDRLVRRPQRPHRNARERRNGLAGIHKNETVVAGLRSFARQRGRRCGHDETEARQPPSQGRERSRVHVVGVMMRAKNQVDAAEFLRGGRGRSHALVRIGRARVLRVQSVGQVRIDHDPPPANLDDKAGLAEPVEACFGRRGSIQSLPQRSRKKGFDESRGHGTSARASSRFATAAVVALSTLSVVNPPMWLTAITRSCPASESSLGGSCAKTSVA